MRQPSPSSTRSTAWSPGAAISGNSLQPRDISPKTGIGFPKTGGLQVVLGGYGKANLSYNHLNLNIFNLHLALSVDPNVSGLVIHSGDFDWWFGDLSPGFLYRVNGT